MLHYLQITDSTNNFLKRWLRGEETIEGITPTTYDPLPTTIYTFYQTAGRGQQGNSWESEEGKNLLFSMLFRRLPIEVDKQFRLSELIAVACRNIIARYVEGKAAVTIKWPNDIYADDKKIAGILIEHSIGSKSKSQSANTSDTHPYLDSSIAGVGINVNQTIFRSSAPNPISIVQISDSPSDLHQLMQEIEAEVCRLLPLLNSPATLHEMYMSHLYRKGIMSPFVEREVNTSPTTIATPDTDNIFYAQIIDVTPLGQLVLLDDRNHIRTYHFKEVRFVI